MDVLEDRGGVTGPGEQANAAVIAGIAVDDTVDPLLAKTAAKSGDDGTRACCWLDIKDLELNKKSVVGHEKILLMRS
jgi:hypothetical protein